MSLLGKFLDSPKEVEEGYYLFRFKTNGYSMLFPVEGKIGEKSYQANEEFFEVVNFGVPIKDENISYNILLTYDNQEYTNDIDASLGLLSSSQNYEGTYEESNSSGKKYYFAERIHEVEGAKSPYYNYFAYIKSSVSNQAIRFQAYSTCIKDDIPCEAGSQRVKELILKLMKSIEFEE